MDESRRTLDLIRLRGVRQNNLKDIDLDLPRGALILLTGVSGCGKSSLAFDTLYAEGQRRYVETFSPYARQFLERMDRPAADLIEGIPPAIAIDQINPVRTSRSTVGTLSELNDHLKLLFARGARPYCRGCGRAVRRDTPADIWQQLCAQATSANQTIAIAFTVPIPSHLDAPAVETLLAQQGYIRTRVLETQGIEVIQDRLRVRADARGRALEALETALARGQGRIAVYPLDSERQPGPPWRFSDALHCPDCDIPYAEPTPGRFSFNSPVGACPTCRGFGRTLGIDWSRVVPDPSKSLIEGAIKPIQSAGYSEIQEDLMGFAHRRGIPTDVPWRDLTDADRDWVIAGEGEWETGVWYGLQRFFTWLEGRSYKMHVRVLLSRYRAYDVCATCQGARLVDEALDWRLGSTGLAQQVLEPAQRFRHARVRMSEAAWQTLPGLCLHDLMQLPLSRCRAFCDALVTVPALDQLMTGIRARLRYLCEVGLEYLSLGRQSRTLSGGEMQRIHLTSALGSTLVNTLFVLDEPSIGLHPRDLDRIIAILQRLRDQGNSLVVVEHDQQVMRAADQIVDLGPGPGEQGGRILFSGLPSDLPGIPGSLTGDYLAGRLQIASTRTPTPPDATGHWLKVRGAAAHNLKRIDVAIPLHRLVVVTGVSGSGKSTLVEDVLYQALCQLKGHPVEPPGEHEGLDGATQIADVVLLDQSGIGRTTRSNPASYVGAFEVLRKRFAAQPLAQERGYTAGTFSFNSGQGRCPTCGGSGSEHLEMQFLADVDLRCVDCDGRRYRAPVLEVRLNASADDPGSSIADILEMTTTEALACFAEDDELQRALAPLLAVGLGYLRLGQPVPTLSGGEAQRLKLAGHLAKSSRGKARDGGLLFLLDEPTTGLHAADVAILLAAFQELLRAGHSLLIIEHHLDLIAAADWLIDLGPEGGAAGGALVCAGTPAQLARHPTSHTGQALRDRAEQHRAQAAAAERATPPSDKTTTHQLLAEAPAPFIASRAEGPAPDPSELIPPLAHPAHPVQSAIQVIHAREHNLKNLSLTIARDRFIVITGVSGSGKSTLAFDILFAEGQRRFLESLNAHARQFVQPAARPDVDAVLGIPPTIAIEQRTSRGGIKSTVGTLTEIHPALRLLYARLGRQHCPHCDSPIEPMSREAILARIQRDHAGRQVTFMAPLVQGRKGLYRDLADWAARHGWPVLRVDGEPLETHDWPRLDRYREHQIDLPVGEIRIQGQNTETLGALLEQALDLGKGTLRVVTTEAGSWGSETPYSTRRACPCCGVALPELDPRHLSFNSPHGWCPSCLGTGLAQPDGGAGSDTEESGGTWPDPTEHSSCPSCQGTRLNDQARAVRFHERTIAELTALTVDQAHDWLAELRLDDRATAIARDLLNEIRERLTFLGEIGLGYLTLARSAPTLSGGEAQRIRLAAQLGSNLRGVCYILDEPTIGLHPRDNHLLLNGLERLRAKGNSIIVVEHDEETIRRADEVIDLGPGAGREGGLIVARGTVSELIRNPASVTGRALARRRTRTRPIRTCTKTHPKLVVKGAQRHNLRGVEARIPLARLVCVTGVSGSGKSTLIREILVPSLRHLLAFEPATGSQGLARCGCRQVTGWQALGRVLEVDQTPIGKTPRSCPATYVGIWDAIRRLFAATPEARLRGWGPSHFSFNTSGGRCVTCEGQGVQTLEMNFLPDARMTCEACQGERFERETREIRYLGHDIGAVLALSVDEAVEVFHAHPSIRQRLLLLREVGLGYLQLGQPSPTLSGGEAQRIKLVTELAKARIKRKSLPTLYVLDEPTVGLHMADVSRLLEVLHRLVESGHTVVVIEHNLDVMTDADWIIDLGPDAGNRGGRIVAAGTPETVANAGPYPTALALSEHLASNA
ncbi:excinuclease ABC subunit A [Thiocapsa imhoffii]|uniref:UvrABC system protein A n=1 Tax=Thiocapsa imhoffii TaxID=382777 RepID=A0A9X0WEU3_9GAMM|nr:excinuclease ABC subunit UvrA [Thiocapsa imhoffii]MBK1643283.1 excinuclease ABC subunit A [Thiocapsa imhoffii]